MFTVSCLNDQSDERIELFTSSLHRAPARWHEPWMGECREQPRCTGVQASVFSQREEQLKLWNSEERIIK